ncbi:hypothetical protein [Desulfotruncus alcoholivorax]|uniref:hypothetical protein n=1 Tax=Desulfotruncus alcoholivorax TaxID=265477 RepID=UPI0006859BC1|nr:hypothetical protein [Desulfotruncus alcoholivorax]
MSMTSIPNKTIRFIDSEYRELFCIPDGANINIIYPPEDGRGTVTSPCKYLDEMHVRVGGNDFHCCEFASRMKAIGARYEPETQLRGVKIIPYAVDDEKYFDLRSDEGKIRIGHLAGDFGNQGDRFHANFYTNEKRSDKITTDFQAELHSAVYTFRKSILKDRAAMIAFCHAHPEAKLLEDSHFAQYGFKITTDEHQYFVYCHVPECARDARFTIYVYSST